MSYSIKEDVVVEKEPQNVLFHHHKPNCDNPANEQKEIKVGNSTFKLMISSAGKFELVYLNAEVDATLVDPKFRITQWTRDSDGLMQSKNVSIKSYAELAKAIELFKMPKDKETFFYCHINDADKPISEELKSVHNHEIMHLTDDL